jgi:hypothetical protein
LRARAFADPGDRPFIQTVTPTVTTIKVEMPAKKIIPVRFRIAPGGSADLAQESGSIRLAACIGHRIGDHRHARPADHTVGSHLDKRRSDLLSIRGYARTESVPSDVGAWLFDPTGSHGLGSAVLGDPCRRLGRGRGRGCGSGNDRP